MPTRCRGGVGLRYVELNPVSAQLVASTEQSPESSAAEHLSADLAPGSMLEPDGMGSTRKNPMIRSNGRYIC